MVFKLKDKAMGDDGDIGTISEISIINRKTYITLDHSRFLCSVWKEEDVTLITDDKEINNVIN